MDGPQLRNRQIPKSEWVAFLEDFSRRHLDRLATVEVLGPLGAQVEARELPLMGLSCEPSGRSVTIYLGHALDQHLEHPIDAPWDIWVEMGENGAELALEVESRDGTRTILALGEAPACHPSSR